MPTYDQANALLAMHTTLAGWPAVLTELDGEDRLSAPFVYRVRFATEAPVAAVKALVGTEVTLFLGNPLPDAPDIQRRRPINGRFRRVSRIGRASRDGALFEWQAEVVPALWLLSQSSDFRIFHDRTIPQIIADVLDRHGIAFADRIVVPEAYGTLEYCVQYDETALDFVSRLMEHAGIFYWHEHTDVAHTLCFTDNNNNVRIPHPAFATLVTGQDGVLDSFDEHYSFRTGTWTVRDHNLTRPQRAWDKTESFADVAGADAAVVEQLTRFERYRYPGNYMARLRATADGAAEGQIAQHDADLMATRLIELEESHWERWTGAGIASAIDAGTKLRIDPATGAGASDFLVVGVRHQARDYTCWTGEEWALRRGEGVPLPAPACTMTLDAAPHAVPFRPDRATRKPRAGGPQTALVVGPAGQDINVDEYGRVQVQFLWDRGSGSSANDGACWLRVSQGWAGAGWGQIHVPRVGQEVIVDFLNGDPDRPIVVGRVYNTTDNVPYALPAHASQSGIRTRSTPGGTADNYNELRFEDAKGAEQVLLHAERDYVVEVENNETRTVGIGSGIGDRTTAIKRDEIVTIGGDRNVTITGDANDTVSGAEARHITKDVTEHVGGNVTMVVAQDVSVTAGPEITMKANSSITLTAPTVNINATDHNKWTSKYDWEMGTGAGSFYLTTNYQALVTTNAYVTSVTAVGAAFTLTKLDVTVGDFSDETKALMRQRAGAALRSAATAVGRFGVELLQAEAALYTSGVYIHR